MMNLMLSERLNLITKHMKYILIFRDLYTYEKKCHLFGSIEEAQAWANKIDPNRIIGIRELDEPVWV